MPYPPDPRRPPHLVFRDLPIYGWTPQFSWMPDSRRIVLSSQATPNGSAQLWLADTVSGDLRALTSGPGNSFFPAVSPMGDASFSRNGVLISMLSRPGLTHISAGTDRHGAH